MAALQQCILAAGFAAVLVAADPGQRTGPRFLVDDPIQVVPSTHSVVNLKWRAIDDIYDFVDHSFATPRRIAAVKRTSGLPIARDLNTLGEVPDHSFYTNRHYTRPMTIEELRRGPGNQTPPKGIMVVTGAKSDGVTPGFTVRDEAGHKYLLKFDPADYPEMASGADMIGSKVMYALGYFTPENYIIHFRPDSLAIAPGAVFRLSSGRSHLLTVNRIRRLLRDQPRDKEGEVRALASRWVEGETIGPFKYSGSRTDDPNDIIPHEDRRTLRGMAVFGAWINHTDAKAINSMDAVLEDGGRRYIRHYLIDFGSCFGSDSLSPKLASRGNVFDVDPTNMLRQVAGLGFYAPAWQRARTPKLKGVGRFEAVSFEPRDWKPGYPNPAFLRMTEDDAFWAARQVAAFTDEQIRAMVDTAEYSDRRSSEYIARVLSVRRDKIAEAYLSGRLAVDRFHVKDDRLEFDDLRTRPASPEISWAGYNNESGTEEPWNGATGRALPQQASQLGTGRFCVATLRDSHESVRVYLRRDPSAWAVVGILREEGSRTEN